MNAWGAGATLSPVSDALLTDLPWAAAAGFGALHALIPCAHGWPVLVPLATRRRSSTGPGLCFGVGVTLGSAAIGGLAGAFGRATLSHLTWTETLVGVAMIGLGLMYVLSPKWFHAGHLHGDCQPHDEKHAEPHCGHNEHGRAGAAARKGPLLGAFLLGLLNMAAPCYSNLTGLTLAVESKGMMRGVLTLGAFGISAGIVTLIMLAMVRRGVGLLGKLASDRFEAIVLRASGVFMVIFGLLTVFHIGHHHG